MKIIDETALIGRSDIELVILFDIVSKALPDTRPRSPSRQRLIENLQNIDAARSALYRQSRLPGY